MSLFQPVVSAANTAASGVVSAANLAANTSFAVAGCAATLLIAEVAMRAFGFLATQIRPEETKIEKQLTNLVNACRPFKKLSGTTLATSIVATLFVSTYGAQLLNYGLGKAPAFSQTVRNWMGPATANFNSNFQHPVENGLRNILNCVRNFVGF